MSSRNVFPVAFHLFSLLGNVAVKQLLGREPTGVNSEILYCKQIQLMWRIVHFIKFGQEVFDVDI